MKFIHQVKKLEKKLVLYRREIIVILDQFLSIIIYFIFLCWLVWYLSFKLLLKFIRLVDESKALILLYLFNKKICNKISLYVKKKLVK